jgi:hypothetical protein
VLRIEHGKYSLSEFRPLNVERRQYISYGYNPIAIKIHIPKDLMKLLHFFPSQFQRGEYLQPTLGQTLLRGHI